MVLQANANLFGGKTPCHTSCRRWFNQVGYYNLEVLPIDQAKRWIFIIDNSIRIENRKMCLILAAEQSVLEKGKCLSFKSMRVVSMKLINKNAEVEGVLEEAIKKAGIPVSICSDNGPDLMPSIRKILNKYPTIKHISDVMHKTGNMLKKLLEADKKWKKFIKHVNQSKNRLKQSTLSFLCPPNMRGKQRFLNCINVIHWAQNAQSMLESMATNDPNYEIIFQKLGWIIKQKVAIEYFAEVFELAGAAKEIARKLHIDKNVWKHAKNAFETVSCSKAGKEFANELVVFLKEQGMKVKKGETLLGSSEIIESAMSKLKLLDRECGNSGYTRSILGLAACFGPVDCESIGRAFEEVREKDVISWSAKQIGETTHSKRRRFLKASYTKKLNAKLTRIIEKEMIAA